MGNEIFRFFEASRERFVNYGEGVTKIYRKIGSVFWLLVAVYITASSYQLGLGNFHKPGPGRVFFLAALLLAIFSVVELAGSFIKETKGDKEDGLTWRHLQWQRIIFFIVSISAYIYFLNFLGFPVATFLLMSVLFKITESMKWWASVFASLITTLSSYVIFKIWLMVPFPSGFLGF